MRVFVAAEVADGLLEALVETQASLRAAVRGRYVPPDSLHVTLAFLGEVPALGVDSVIGAVRDATRGMGPAGVSLGALGAFGQARKATLWQAVDGPGLGRLAHAVREALDDVGLAYDAKAFLGHVTLMRSADLTRGILPPASRAEGQVGAVRVWRSRLDADGASYETLGRVPLGVWP